MIITPAEFEDAMKKIAENETGNTEGAHIAADDLMCEILISFGYEAGVRLFKGMHKWYA